MQQREIEALISLLDDPDREVNKHVRQELMAHATEVLPILKNYFDISLSATHLIEIQEMIAAIQFDAIKVELKNIINGKTDYIAFLSQISLLLQHDNDIAAIQKKYERVKQTIWLEMGNNQTFLEQLHIFNKVFYEVLKFSGDPIAGSINEFDIYHVLENKKGSIISIGMLYLALANEMGLRISGVCLQKYFILCTSKAAMYGINEESTDLENYFYINPINNGILFAKKDIDLYLKNSSFEKKLTDYLPATFKQICIEFLHYMAEYLENTYQHDLLQKIRTLIEMLK